MFLDKLVISAKFGIIREVKFNPQGVTLITSYDNSVGKTTLLRAVDFCLGSDGKDIYTDKEFKTVNEIKDYLESNEVAFTLYLNTISGKSHVLFRQFEKGGHFINLIDAEDYLTNKYAEGVMAIVFGARATKPTLRQIMPKFIRKEEDTKNNTLKYLHGATTNADYETIRLFLFGFSDKKMLSDRLSLKNILKKAEDKLKVLLNKSSLNKAEQVLKGIENDIMKKEKEEKNFQLDSVYDEDLKTLNILNKKVNDLTSEISNIELKITLNKETLQELKSNIANVDSQTIKELYEEATNITSDIHKTFEETLYFHNTVIQRKVDFVSKNIEDSERLLANRRTELPILLAEKTKIFNRLQSKGSFADIQKLQSDINMLYQKKGEEVKFIDMVKEAKKEVEINKHELEELVNKLKIYTKDLQNNITIFNNYFREYSTTLYNEQYVMYVEIDQDFKKFDFKIEGVEANVGGGKKKAQITAFDLAYISFIDEMNINLPKFVIHDSIEDIDSTQIKNLFDIANSINGQYIVSVLENVLDSSLTKDFIKSKTQLELSENDKFFKF